MRENLIKVSPFEFLSILSCSITKKINEHATAIVEGYIHEDLVDKCIGLGLSNTWTTIQLVDENGTDKVVFCGLVKDCSVSSQSNLNKLTLTLISGTSMMDTVDITKTYQNKDMSYKAVLEGCTNKYSGNFIMTVGNGSTLGEFIVQYKETDWEFVKRLASHFNSCVVPVTTSEGLKYYFGLPDSAGGHEIKETEYSIKKDVKEYINKTNNKVSGLGENDEIYYIVESREAYDIWDNIIFKGRNLYVYSIESYLRDSELIHKYVLKSKNGFKIIKKYNNQIIGASLEANIIGIKNDTVKVSIKVDRGQDIGVAKWFSFSTVYSSPDGSGWYCMPENGDEVRVYFPSEKERHAYVISAVHLESGDASARSNPDNKSLKSKYNKEVLFTDNSITMTNNKGMEVKIVDGEGISIISDKAITIKSDDSISISSINNSVEMLAKDSIKMEQGDTKLTLKDDISLSGSQVKIE